MTFKSFLAVAGGVFAVAVYLWIGLVGIAGGASWQTWLADAASGWMILEWLFK